MTMRRNIISLLIWISVIAIFSIHVILTHRKDEAKHKAVSERSITQVKTTILKRTELENFKIHNYAKETNSVTRAPKRIVNSKIKFGNYNTNDRKKDQDEGEESSDTYTKILEDEVEKLKAENVRLLEREKKFKNLAKQLASKLKDKEGVTLPKLDPSVPWVFTVTPTYSRYTQKADLVRLSQTLLLVTNLHWIIIEDSTYRTDLVTRLLKESGLSFTHLNTRTPTNMQRKKWEKHNKHHRGVSQRNLGLKWLRDNVNPKNTPGAVYFMDDDNTYHRKIFDEIRWTQRVSMWPVGLSGGARWAGPIVSNGKVVGFHTNWAPDRKFPTDMAGFAISLNLLVKEKPGVKFNSTAKRGFLEPNFLETLTTVDQLEPLADNCTKVLVWHTRTEVPKESIKGEKALMKIGKASDASLET